MSDPQSADPGVDQQLDEAVRAAEQHVAAEEQPDADETVVTRDLRDVDADEEPTP